ncbi:MAG: DNA translocase FtsK, partial [Pseudorhodobacter sp.]
MASYQIRQRDPLLDQGTQAMLERRTRELFGLAIIALGLAFVAMLWTYSPQDPGWMVASDKPISNALGGIGAALASTLVIIGGKGVWTIPLILIAWGLRFVTHRGAERVLSRMVFAVIAIALAAVYCATLVPGAEWSHSFGLGGLFGDTVVGALLGLLPVGAGLALKLLSLATGAVLLVLVAFVMGFTMPEIRELGRFLLTSLVLTYSGLLGAANKGAQGTARAAAAMQDRRKASATAPAMAEASHSMVRRAPPPVVADDALAPPAFGRPSALRADTRYREPLSEAPHYAPPREKVGLLARMPALLRRNVEPEPELVEPVLAHDHDFDDLPDDDRIKARISQAVKSRTRAPETALSPIAAAIQRREPGLTRPRGPSPLIADTRAPGQRAEPPVMAAVTPVAPAPVQPNAFAHDDGISESYPEMVDDDFDASGTDWQPEPYVDPAPAPAARVTPVTLDRRPVVQHAVKKPAQPSTRALAEAQPRLRFDDATPEYELPPLSLLTNPASIQRHALSDESLEENARMLETVLDDYGVKGEIVSVRPGPVVTMYELEPAPGLKASRVIGLADDIARSMSALSARVSTVPGRTVIGIELPNAQREKVVLREILAARDFGDSNLRLPLALGKDIGGDPIVANLAKMPHLLIAGTTGSGKSVAINTMILSLLYKLTPEECRLIMIDPKMLELSVYDGIPHLLSPVVTDPKKAVVALKWVVGEMEERYRKMSKMGVRNIEGYNGRVREALAKGEMFKRTIQTGFDEDTGEPVFETEEFAPVALPYIVVIVDEMADLMMVAGKEIEACIQRLAQMARASGIHLIMATQRPSVDVITGTIKANFPTRISFQVTSKIDSRTILGEQGAEQLLGMGDMLY